MKQVKLKLLWYIKGNLGDCILSCYSLLRVNLDKVDITICTNELNAKLISELKLPFQLIVLKESILSSFRSFSPFKIFHRLYSNSHIFLDDFDISIDPYRWRSGFALDQILSFNHKLKFNCFNSKKYIDFSCSELDIHRKFFDLSNVPYNAVSNFKELIEENSKLIQPPFFDIVIHPFSSEKSRVLKLELISQIVDLHKNKRILLLGTPSDDHLLISKLADLNSINLTIIVENFNFLYLAAQILNCKKVFGSESFIANFSSILSVDTVGFYSGVADPRQWFLPGALSTTIRIDVPCSPCFNKTKCFHDCLDFKINSIKILDESF
jgi:ADP-heptose:LPS heptosyltransferase